MQIREIIKRIDAVQIPNNATITQLKHEDDDGLYQVWKIDCGKVSYVLKESKGDEAEVYQSLLSGLQGGVPVLYQVLTAENKTYLLTEFVQGENLCKCDREKLRCALNALIALQKRTWNGQGFEQTARFYEKSLHQRQNRMQYLKDASLDKAYEQFLRVYTSLPKALCHDDLLPFNILTTKERAVLIDWEAGGILPYPTAFARLIAFGEQDENALFYLSKADREFAIAYYYENLLKDKGICYQDWLMALEHFLFYEYCEWVFVGNKYNATDGEYYQKYLPIAKRQAEKILASLP